MASLLSVLFNHYFIPGLFCPHLKLYSNKIPWYDLKYPYTEWKKLREISYIILKILCNMYNAKYVEIF